jgi:peptide chain release factor subunit 1
MDANQEIFKKKIKALETYRGRHTELISLYVPYNSDRSTVMNQLTNEISQSSNIKSASTRKNVQGALRKIIQYLKVTDFKLPKNGLCLFSGNISEQDGKTDIQLFHVTPVLDLNVKTYRCDSVFFLDPLKEMLAPNKIYGIIAIDNREATIAYLLGGQYKIVVSLESTVPGKIRAGGQSANRFEHLREEAAQDFYKRITEKINNVFLPFIAENKLQGIVFGGPGSSKRKLVEKGALDYRVKDRIIGYVDNTYTDASGIQEIVELSEELLKESELVIEKKEISNFFEKVVKGSLATYGVNEVITALKENKVDKILLYEDLQIDLAEFECETCESYFTSRLNETKCPKCNSDKIEVIEKVDAGDFFYELAQKTNTKIVFITKNTSDGEQFVNAFGGIGAILRY